MRSVAATAQTGLIVHSPSLQLFLASLYKLYKGLKPPFAMRYTGDDIFEELQSILDPERPNLTLAQLDVVSPVRCFVSYLRDGEGKCKPSALVRIVLKPTVPHCHLMQLICLCVRVRLIESLPVATNWKVDVELVDGSHHQKEEIEKQVNDKERVCAAVDNDALMLEVHKLINPFRDDH